MQTTTVRTGRRGTTLVDMSVSLLALVLVAGIALSLLVMTRRFESIVSRRADATDQAAMAHSWLARDVARLQFHPEAAPVTLGPDPVAATRVEFHAARDAAGNLQVIAYAFDAGAGTLTRTAQGEETRTFELGTGSTVRFVKVEPTFAFGLPPVIGAFSNRLSYRITAVAGAPRGHAVRVGPEAAADAPRTRQLTLVGAAPFLTKASCDTFPYWNAMP